MSEIKITAIRLKNIVSEINTTELLAFFFGVYKM